MMGKDATFAHVDRVLGAVDTFMAATEHHETKYHWKKLQEYARALFERAPFRQGDRVRLTKTPEITPEKSWGWMGSKHFLVAGIVGTVRYVDFYDGHFCADVVWDDESWKSSIDGTVHHVELKDRALYHHWETSLKRVAEPPNSNDGGDRQDG